MIISLPYALDLAGTIVFALSGAMAGVRHKLDLFGVLGLALFAVVGAHKALTHGLNPVMATLLGMLTGIGGGMARDILLAQIPTVLRADLYAVAALLGAAVVVIAGVLQLPAGPAALVGAVLCFGLRVLALKNGWRLPTAQPDSRTAEVREP